MAEEQVTDPVPFLGIDLGITDTVGMEWMIRFWCGCWRRIGDDTAKVYNAYHCKQHTRCDYRMDGL